MTSKIGPEYDQDPFGDFPEIKQLRSAIERALNNKDHPFLRELMDQVPLAEGAKWDRLITGFQSHPSFLASVLELMTEEDDANWVAYLKSRPPRGEQ